MMTDFDKILENLKKGELPRETDVRNICS